jgi:hypothetical protein
MNGAACAAIKCACCDAALVPFPEFEFCPACGFITTDAVKAAVQIAQLRCRLAAATTDDIRLDVPNTLVALNEGAWWELDGGLDVHFTAGSLERVVRAEKFEILALSVSDDGRQVHLNATRTVAAPTQSSFDLEDDLAAVAAAVDAFPAAMERQVVRWRRVIEELLGEEKRIVIRGSEGNVAAFLSKVGIDDARVARVIDASRAPDVVIAFGEAAAKVHGELAGLGLRPLVLTP